MSFSIRLVIIASNLVLTAVALAVGRADFGDMTSQSAEILAIEHKWLLGAAVLYTATYLASWKFKGSFSVSATRMLAWAIIAYMTLSHGIDVLGEHRSAIPTILGLETGGLEAPVLTGVRARLFGLLAIMTMAVTAIAVGFETSESESDI